MAQKKKKVVTTNTPKQKATQRTATSKNKVAAPSAKIKRKSVEKEPLLFGKQNYMLMLLGAGLIVVGMFLMSGGGMPDPNTWDPDIIYSTRRTLIAPIVILAGLVVEIVAIFK
ncbi:MAG: DUF3098 domain-containing protein [Bacteroidota bacterium]